MVVRAKTSAAMTAVAGLGSSAAEEQTMSTVIVSPDPIGANIASQVTAAWRQAVAGDASARIGRRRCDVAALACRTDPAIGRATEVGAVAENADLCLVFSIRMSDRCAVPVDTVSGTDGRMGGEVIMTPLATGTGDADDSEVELRVVPRATELAMAGLAGPQVLFGVRAVHRTTKITAILGMRGGTWAAGMTAVVVKTGRKTAGGCRTAMQVGTVAFAAAHSTVDSCKVTMVKKPLVKICSRMNGDRRGGVIGVARITADGIPAALQIPRVATGAINESRPRQGRYWMGFQPIRRVRPILAGGGGILI